MKYYIHTFGCQQNVSDSERIAAILDARGMKAAKHIDDADHVVLNTCMIRQMAEDRVYGMVHNLTKKKEQTGKPQKIILTGCMVGMAVRDTTGKFLHTIKKKMPAIDEFLPVEEVGFDHPAIRANATHAWVPISNGCNNYCTFCVVPFTRGREISRPYQDILDECKAIAEQGYKRLTLLGMNVNSYGSDLVIGKENIQVMRDIDKKYFDDTKELIKQKKPQGYALPDGREVKPVYVKHLNRLRIPTLFPYLLEDVCQIPGLEYIDFVSSNPWDFSDELIDVIARNTKITRELHIAVQSGSNSVLKRMNRWYTKEEFLALLDLIKTRVPDVRFSTDIIVGFCGETEEEFLETVDLVKKANFFKAYIARYSDRPMTAAHKAFQDNVPIVEKKRRWKILEQMINKPNLKKFNELRARPRTSV